MPELISEQIVTLELADLLKRKPIRRPSLPPTRSRGLHQSGILAHIARKIGVLKHGEPLEEDLPTLLALGFAWEEFCVSLHDEIVWQPGEIIYAGIAMSADGLSNLNDELQLEEFKLTYKSPASGADFISDRKWWMWQHQGRAYCAGYGARVERWHVVHVNQYSTGSFGPVYKQYVVRFSDEECEGTVKMLLNHKDEAEAAGAAE